MITDVGRQWILDFFKGVPGSPLAYIAVGGSPNALSTADTKLIYERFRVPINSIVQDSGVVICEGYFAATEANFSWQEAGLFAGGNGSPDTGKLIARALVNEDKDSMKTANIVWEWGL